MLDFQRRDALAYKEGDGEKKENSVKENPYKDCFFAIFSMDDYDAIRSGLCSFCAL